MIEEIQLVVADIDGTLITTDRILTPRTKDVINRLHEHGIYFGLASGRTVEQQQHHYEEEWGFDFDFEILIGMNGSELWDGIHKKRYDFYKLKREWIKEIIELMQPFELNPFMYYHGEMLCMKLDESMEISSKKNQTGLRIANDISEFWAEENAKIMYRISEEKMPEIEAYLKKHPSPYYKAFKTQTTMLEFCDQRVSKDVGLKKFCAFNNIPLSKVIAFGDISNDNELLEASGWGVCLLNGSADTKAIADDITEKTNDEDGFAHYLEKHLLNKKGW